MGTPAINSLHSPNRPDVGAGKHAKVDYRGSTRRDSAVQAPLTHGANKDKFGITEKARRLADAMDAHSVKEKDVFTKEKLREIAEKIAAGFYEHPEVIEAIVEGYRKEFNI